jgi:hypothetical protein
MIVPRACGPLSSTTRRIPTTQRNAGGHGDSWTKEFAQSPHFGGKQCQSWRPALLPADADRVAG